MSTPAAQQSTAPASALSETALMSAGLRRRLLVLLLLPLGLLALLSAYVDYRAAGTAAAQHDEQLQRYVPLLAGSVVGPGYKPDSPPLMLLAPALEEFLKERGRFAAYRISDTSGAHLLGDAWVPVVLPLTDEPEFHGALHEGVTYRVVAQRVRSSAGDLVVQLADGSNPRQQWLRSVLIKVLLPNVLIILASGFAVNWAVQRALRPLNTLRQALEERSPRDLSEIEWQSAPEEVRPLVTSLNRLFALVNAQAESQRRFVADAAHQLRTPLAGLQSQVEAWAQQAAQPRSNNGESGKSDEGGVTLPAEQLYKLRTATRRTSQLANQLLALSRADSQAMQTQPLQTLELKTLCEEALSQFIDAASAKQIDLGLEATHALVQGHVWLLRELLVNLTDNAIKYTPASGTVTIRCGWRGAQAFLELEDDGPGIPQAERAHVTERFYRLQGTQAEGNGLGLAIADEIARLHHAQLLLGPGGGGRGLCATVLFPAAASAA
jgi:two-component system, OmpR family, sensor histidine kinase TctE